MRLHEYEAADIFEKHGIPVPTRAVASTADEAARIAEFTHEWENAARLYGQAFEHMKRARGLSVETQRLRELAECVQRIAAEASADSP